MLQHVYVPIDLGEAIARLSEGSGTALLAGGTLLMPVVNNEPTDLQSLVSMRRLRLDGISIDGSKATMGAATTLADLGRDVRLSFLTQVVESIASPPIRNLATVGGNLFAPQPYGDFAVSLLALDASVQIAAIDGRRNAAVGDVLTLGVGANEIVTAIEFAIPTEGTWFYTKAMRRKLNSASIVTVAAVIETRENIVTSARIALGGVGPRPLRAASVEAALVGMPLDTEVVSSAAALAVADVQPFSDAYASAWYRERVLPVHIRRAIIGE